MSIRLLPIAALVLTGCSNTQSAQPAAPPGPATAGPGAAPAALTVYACPDGFRFSVWTLGDSVALRLPAQTLTLPRVPAASGAKYQAGDALFWSKGDEAMLETAAGKYDSCRGTPAETPWEEARLRGVEFRAVGQEPGWLLEIDQGHSITYTGDYGRTQVIAPDPGSGRYSNPGAARSYSVRSEGRAVSVIVDPIGCTDAMSGERFPYAVSVTVDRDRVKGCGRTLVTGDLIGVYWKLVELDGRPVIAADPYGRGWESIFPAFEAHLRITDQGRTVAGGTGCKEFRGRAEIAGERVKLGPLTTRPTTVTMNTIGSDSVIQLRVDTTTGHPCMGPEMLSQEQRFLGALESADRLEAKVDSLTIYAGVRPVCRFGALYLR